MNSSSIRHIDSTSDRMVIEADFPHLTAAQLFDAFTQPTQITKWWSQQAELDAKLGGTYHLGWPSMDWHLRGIYTAFEPGKTLGFTWQWDHQPDLPPRHVIITIQQSAAGRTLRLEHGSYGDGAEELEDRQNHMDGWYHFLSQLLRWSEDAT